MWRTNRPTNQPTDGRMDKAGCRVACTQLKSIPEKHGFDFLIRKFQNSSGWLCPDEIYKVSKFENSHLFGAKQNSLWQKFFKLWFFKDRMHATLQPALSVRPSVSLSVGRSVTFLLFLSILFPFVILSHLRVYWVILSHSKSLCKSCTQLIGVGLVYEKFT